jgi:hypothetical protein
MYQQQGYTFDAVIPAVFDAGVVNSLCTFQEPDGLLTGAGQPSGNYIDVTGYIGIPCMDAPTSNLRITAREQKTEAQIESSNSDHIWLAGFYVGIESNTQWRVAVTDAAGNVRIGDVTGAECDSQARTTRVAVQWITV